MIKTKPIVYEERYYNIKQTCGILDIHRETLNKYTASGRISCVRFSPHNIMYLGSEILRFWNKKNMKHDL